MNLPYQNEPITWLLFAVAYEMAGDLVTRMLFVSACAHKSTVYDGQPSERLRKTFDNVATVLFHLPALVIFTFGAMMAWHLGRISTTGWSLGCMAFFFFVRGFLKGEKVDWSINHFRRQRQNWMFTMGVVYNAIIIGLNQVWHYEDPVPLHALIFALAFGNYYIFLFEVDHWKEVGVNIAGSLGDQLCRTQEEPFIHDLGLDGDDG